jgi:hypothetical protein
MFGPEGYLNAKGISVRYPTEQEMVATTRTTAGLSAVVMSVMVVVRWCRAGNACDCGNSD